MIEEQVFNLQVRNISEIKESFRNFSAIQVKSLFPKDLCQEACEFIKRKESNIISKYCEDRKGLVLETINSKSFIKYFDKPLIYNYNLFRNFLSSNVFNLSQNLIGENVFLQSYEIHSRLPSGTKIPIHQDNAYYGLKEGKSLTFYISLNNQDASSGGLRYYKVPIGKTRSHKLSNLPGFSLQINDENYKNFKVFDPIYNIGDCSIHHSTSIHFADEMPKNAERVFVIRLTFHAVNDFELEDHKDWYRKIVEENRNK